MKKSELVKYIKEEIIDTLNESPSSEELRMARQAVYRFMKYRQVEAEEAIRDLINALEELQRRGVKGKLSEEIPSKEEVEDLNKELEKTVELSKELSEDIDDDAEPKASDISSTDSVSVISRKLQDTTKEMKSTVNQWKKAEGEEKERLLARLKELTKIKKELEGLL